MTYRVNASIRNIRGKEIAHRTPLWSGEADDPKAAIIAAHDALAPIVKGMEHADTIILHLSGPKGLRVTATEYAEDFRIAYGASAVGGTGLLADQIDTGLTAAQQLDAMRALKERAIKAMPGLAPKTLDADSSTGLERCKNKFNELDYLDSAQPTGELDRIMRDFGTEVEDANSVEYQISRGISEARQSGRKPYSIHLSQRAAHQMVKEDKTGLGVPSHFNGLPVYVHYLDPDYKPDIFIATGADALHTPSDDLRTRNRARTKSSTATIRDRIMLAIQDLVCAGKEPSIIHLSRDAHMELLLESSVGVFAEANSVHGLPIKIHDDRDFPPIQIGCKSRRQPVTFVNFDGTEERIR